MIGNVEALLSFLSEFSKEVITSNQDWVPENVDFSRQSLEYADFSYCYVEKCNFSNSLLAQANISQATVSKSDFNDCDMSGIESVGTKYMHNYNLENAIGIPYDMTWVIFMNNFTPTVANRI